jgi:opacity protein-like surface antigen
MICAATRCLAGAVVAYLLIFCSPVSSVLAADHLRGIEVTPFAGYRFGGSFEDEDTEEDFDLDDDGSLGLILNFPASEFTEYEIYYSRQDTSVDVSGFVVTPARLDMQVEYLQIGGTYLFDTTEKVQPYFVATVGIAKLDPDAAGTNSDTFFSFGVGGGWKFNPNKRVGLRLDGRLLGTLISSDTDIFCQTGPQGNVCAVNIKGESLYQFELQAGVIFRF